MAERLNSNEKLVTKPEKQKVRFNLLPLAKCFIGRKMELESIHKSLRENKESKISQVAAITGLGGIGKSQLAVKYAVDYSDYYDNIIFINSEKKDNIVTSFKSLSKELNIPTIEERVERKRSSQREKSIINIVHNIYKYFEGTKLLIILDNVESYSYIKDCIFSYFSSNKTFSALITARDWRCCMGDEGDIDYIPLEKFTDDEANSFIKNNLDESVEDVKKLIETLNNLPLAMMQALSYINLEKVTIKRYLELFVGESHIFFDNDIYDKTIVNTWMIAIKKIEENTFCGQLALKILHILSYFSPENIPFEESFSDLAIDDEQLWDAVELLHKYSLIDLKNGIVYIHRLVQKINVYYLKRFKKEEEILGLALELLKDSDYEDHAVSVWEHSSQYSKLIDDFYNISTYGTRKKNPLILLVAYRDDSKAIESLRLHESTSGSFKIGSFAIEYPLCIAAEYGNINVVDFFCNNENKIEKFILHIALHQAAINGHIDVVNLLQNKLKILNLKNEIDDIIFDKVSINGYKKVIEILKPYDNELYLFYASLMRALLNGNHNVYKSMIENVIVNNPKFLQHKFGYEESSILHIVSEKGTIEAVEILLNYIDMNICNKFNETPILSAAKASNEDVLNFLLQKGADYEITELRRRSVLHFAATACNVDTLRTLVKKGLDWRSLDEFLHIPIYYAAVGNNKNAIKFFFEEALKVENKVDLINKLAMENFQMKTIHQNKVDLINKLVIGNFQMKTIHLLTELGIDVDVINKCNTFALMEATLNNKYNDVKYLLEAGVDPNIYSSGYYKIPLHQAVVRKSVKIVKLLLKAGADPNMVDKYGYNALHKTTIFENKLLIAQLLVKYGCDIRAINEDGETPLDITISWKRNEIIGDFLKNLMSENTKSLE